MKSRIKRSPLLALLEANQEVFNQEYEQSGNERNAFMEAARNFSTYGEAIYRGSDITEAVTQIAALVEQAAEMTLKETDGWFDNVTASRHTKQMKESLKVLQKEATEIAQRQQRLEAAYEDIGQLLGRYYEV